MRIKNDINQSNICRDDNSVAAMEIGPWLGRSLNRMKAGFLRVCCFAKSKVCAQLEPQRRLVGHASKEQTKSGLASKNKLSPAAKLHKLEQAYDELLQEKSIALKSQMQSQNHLAQVAAELAPTLNELGGLAHVSAARWRNDFSDQDGKEFAERLEFTSQHVLSIVQDFADLAKLKTGDVTLNQQEIDPGELIKDAISTVQGLADRLLVDLQSKPQGQKILVYGDLNRMRQMLLRSLFIAIEFVGEDGFVKLRTDLKPCGGFGFYVEFGGGIKAVLHQRMIGKHKIICGEKFASNWGRELVAKLINLHEGKIIASQDDFGTHLWEMKMPKPRVTVLDVESVA